MPLNWLGTLEQRPSALTQALAALQPASEQIRDWLAKRPDIERQMAASFVNVVTQMQPEAQRAFLSQAPNLDRMLALVDKHIGPGLYRRNEDGTVEFMTTSQVAQAGTQAEQAEYELEVQKATNLLTPLVEMPEADFEAYRTTEEAQARLRQIADSPLGNYVRTLEDGTLTLMPNAREILTRRQAEATIGKTQAETKELTASAGKLQMETTRMQTLLDEELAGLVSTRQLTDAQRQRILTLLPAELEKAWADVDITKASTEDIRAKIEPSVRKILAEAGVDEATTKQILDTLPVQIEKLRVETEEGKARTELVREQAASIRAEREAFVEEWQTKRPYLAKTAELQFKLLEQQLEAGEVSIEQAQAQVERIKKDTEEADARITDMVERRGIDQKFIEAQISKIQAETKEIETTLSAKTQLMLAEAEWYKQQGIHLTSQDALAWAAFEHQVSIDDVKVALEYQAQQLEREKFEWTKKFEEQKFAENIKLERERLAVEKSNAAAQQRLWAAYERATNADSETARMKAIADVFSTAIAASESVYYMLFPAAKPGTPPGTVPTVESLVGARNTLAAFLTSTLGEDAVKQLEATTGLDLGSLADACLGSILGTPAQGSQPTSGNTTQGLDISKHLTSKESERFAQYMKTPTGQLMAQQLFDPDDTEAVRAQKAKFMVSVMDIANSPFGTHLPADVTTNPTKYTPSSKAPSPTESRADVYMKTTEGSKIAQQLFAKEDSPDTRRRKTQFLVDVMDILTTDVGRRYMPRDLTTNAAQYFADPTNAAIKLSVAKNKSPLQVGTRVYGDFTSALSVGEARELYLLYQQNPAFRVLAISALETTTNSAERIKRARELQQLAGKLGWLR